MPPIATAHHSNNHSPTTATTCTFKIINKIARLYFVAKWVMYMYTNLHGFIHPNIALPRHHLYQTHPNHPHNPCLENPVYIMDIWSSAPAILAHNPCDNDVGTYRKSNLYKYIATVT